MPTARNKKIDLEATPYYHCISSCARNAYLGGVDKKSGRDYRHRAAWIEELMKFFEEIFSVTACAFAVMPDHYHLVLRIDRETAEGWDAQEVEERWGALFSHSALGLPLPGESRAKAQAHALSRKREALCDLSWYMKTMNERIARKANREEGCKGRFWGGRFQSQALFDEAALLTCMAHVDLNPIRTGGCAHPADHPGVSFNLRFPESEPGGNTDGTPSKVEPLPGPNLFPFAETRPKDRRPMHADQLPFTAEDYRGLILATAKMLKDGRTKKISGALSETLENLGVKPDIWPDPVKNFGNSFFWAVGGAEKLRAIKRKKNQRRIRGLGSAKKFYSE